MPVLPGDEQNFTRLKHTLLIGGFEEVRELDHIWIFNIHLERGNIIIKTHLLICCRVVSCLLYKVAFRDEQV